MENVVVEPEDDELPAPVEERFEILSSSALSHTHASDATSPTEPRASASGLRRRKATKFLGIGHLRLYTLPQID